MAIIVPDRRIWTSQPQMPVEIDWNNPLTRGTCFSWNAATPNYELVYGAKASTDNTQKIISGQRAVDCSLSQVNLEWNRSFLATSDGVGTGDFTLILLANPSATGNGSASEHALCHKNDAAGAPYAQALLSFHSNVSNGYASGAACFFTYSAAASSASAAGACDGNWHMWFGVRRGTSHELYKDTALIAQANNTVRNLSQAGRYTAIGSRGNGSTESYRDQAAFAHILNRALTANEIASISSNPWQIFRPQDDFIFVDTVGGGASSVYSDLIDIYYLREAVSGDLADSAAIRALASQDLVDSYSLRSALTSDLADSYDIQTSGTVTSDLADSYLVRSAVSSDMADSYAIRSSVSADFADSYVVRSAVLNSLTDSYAVVTAVSADLSDSYGMAGSVTSDLVDSYSIFATSGACPTADEIAAAVLAAAQVTPIYSNMMQTNNEALIGDGTEGNKFRSHLVP